MEPDLEMALLLEEAEDYIRASPSFLDVDKNPEEMLAQQLEMVKLAQEAKAILPEGEWSFDIYFYKPSIKYCAKNTNFKLKIIFYPPVCYSYSIGDGRFFNYFKGDVHIVQAYELYSKHKSIYDTNVSIENLGMVLAGIGIPLKAP